LSWYLEDSGTAVGAKNHYSRQRVGSKFNIQAIKELALRAGSNAINSCGEGLWGCAQLAGVARCWFRGFPRHLTELMFCQVLQRWRWGCRGWRPGWVLLPAFPAVLAVTHPPHSWDPDLTSSPEISGTFWLGHLESLSLHFFDSKRLLLTAPFFYIHIFGAPASSPHLLLSCQMKKEQGREEGWRLVILGWGLREDEEGLFI
jgi:hypothetical protein